MAILRRSGTDPACVGGVRLRVAVAAPGPPEGRGPAAKRFASQKTASKGLAGTAVTGGVRKEQVLLFVVCHSAWRLRKNCQPRRLGLSEQFVDIQRPGVNLSPCIPRAAIRLPPSIGSTGTSTRRTLAVPARGGRRARLRTPRSQRRFGSRRIGKSQRTAGEGIER
jgi:hypothetical protein